MYCLRNVASACGLLPLVRCHCPVTAHPVVPRCPAVSLGRRHVTVLHPAERASAGETRKEERQAGNALQNGDAHVVCLLSAVRSRAPPLGAAAIIVWLPIITFYHDNHAQDDHYSYCHVACRVT